MSSAHTSLRHYRHFIFDFDGVLCDSLTACIGWFNRVRSDSFPAVPEVRSRADMTVVYAGQLRTCLHRWITQQEAQEFWERHRLGMASVAATLRAFPGITKSLSSLGSRNVSIVTSAYGSRVLTVLREDPDFDESCLYRIEGRERRSSKSAIIREIVASLQIDVSEAIYVGDLESDILDCREVPVDIVSVGYGYHPMTYLMEKGPTYAADTVFDLAQLLRRMQRSGASTVCRHPEHRLASAS
jgi:phosphoglycolate phosphatase-like HAD superfamily hydrolase